MTKRLPFSLFVVVWIFSPVGFADALPYETPSGDATATAVEANPKATGAAPAEQEEGDLDEPGSGHRWLDRLVGEWDAAMTYWNGPDGKPENVTGTSQRQWILGERFLEERLESKNPDGSVSRGRGYTGYNRLTGLYEFAWMINGTTGMFIERGRYDARAGVIRTRGYDTDPESGTLVLTATEIKVESPDRHILTAISMDEDGIPWRQLEITYTRRKPTEDRR